MTNLPRISLPYLILVLFIVVPVTLWSGPPIGKFNPDQDLFLPQFDSKTDVDDIQSIAAVGTILRDPSLAGINFHAVAGAYGIQEGLYVPAPELFSLAFGERWTNAHEHREQSLEEITQLVSETLTKGGHVWVAEAGQSDFTADWLKRVNGLDLSTSSKTHVHVVQHSAWNESMTSADKLAYVKQHADYQKIADGNAAGNGTPGFSLESGDLWERVVDDEVGDLWRLAREISDKYNGRDGRYKNEAIAAGGMDFSDTAETCWIFGFTRLKDAEAFVSRFID